MRAITRRNFMKGAALASAGVAACAQAAPARRMPNVIYILTDQQRKDTLSCYGNPHAHTPALDALARGGVRFTSCYTTQPVCSPCRSSMVTGLFPNATGVVENNIPLSGGHFSWPRALHDRGYRTAHIGKWHLGVDPVPNYFDIWKGYHTGWPHWIEDEPVYQLPGETVAQFEQRVADRAIEAPDGDGNIGRYRPDLETDHAIDFIRSCGDRPFLCWLSFYPPHTTKTVPEEDLDVFRGRFDNEDQDIYHAMAHRVDTNVGRLMTELDRLGLRDNTLVVYVSEHGENHPLRWNGHLKRLCYDQSATVPLIMSWRGVLPEGRVVDTIFSVADLMPTILDFCGVSGPEESHGQSARHLINGDGADWHKDIFIQNTPYRWDAEPVDGIPLAEMRERAVVTDAWKLILNTHREPELYRRHIGRPDEVNVYGAPDTAPIAKDLVKRLRAWGERTGDAMAGQLADEWASRNA